MTASKIYLYIHGHGYPGLRSGKSSLLALCTDSLCNKQVNGAGAWQTELSIKPFLASTPK
ncbi:hypothetical protein CFOL_v3_33785 [Cephalotus follicularis]|uniref:Uncharacterized protein n=1 Tax=Cephalotus follicularis TaxID=3775 RepID=A0A1Q3DCV5_CEPFO|nr:hypothetical protein CFOL_v3_33785 [Cephalotus follicularis]